MAGESVLARLLRLRELEEEQCRLQLEAAVGHQRRVGQAREAIVRRQVAVREEFAAQVGLGDSRGRSAMVFEMELAGRRRARVEQRVSEAESAVQRQREEFLERRTGRQQVESLIETARSREEIETARRAQQMLDDWYSRRSAKR